LGRQEVVRRYYNEMWNKWDFNLANKLLHHEIRFRASLVSRIVGILEFKKYMITVRSAFPDFHNQIEELVGQRDMIAVRLKYTGSHLGPIFGIRSTGKRISYSGAAFYRFMGNKIAKGWVLGDVLSLLQQLRGCREDEPEMQN
jgi:predicted ester cyclase